MRRSLRMCLVALTASVAATAPACASETDSDESTFPVDGAEQDPLRLEAHEYFYGLDEWILIHKGRDGYWCRRADGRVENCEEVKREDRAAYFAKYGVMTKEFADEVFAAHEGDTLFGLVLFDVPAPPELKSQDPATRQAALAEMEYRIRKSWATWKRLVFEADGTVTEPPGRFMPMFVMKGPPAAFKRLAWAPGLTGIGKASTGPARFGFAEPIPPSL